MPKRQDPGHPLAAAAADELAGITAMLPNDDPTPAPNEPAPGATSSPDDPPVTPPVTPTPPEPVAPVPDRFAVLEHRFDTVLGRLEKTVEENRDLKGLVEKVTQNREFVESKVNELLAEKRRLEAKLEAVSLGREFKSEVIDQEQFNEILRGITPVLQRRDERIDELVSTVNSLKDEIATTRVEADKRVSGVRKEVTERLLLRDEPEFQKLLARKDFQDFLAQRIPGSRRTRLQEVQDAYNEGDTGYMKDVAEAFRLLAKPRAVDAGIEQPPRSVADQTPRAPKPETPVTDDDVQRAFEAMNRNEISVAQYKAIRKRQRDQEVAGR